MKSWVARFMVAVIGSAALIGAALVSHPAKAAGSEVIDHIVVLMQENRSADHYFARLKDAGLDFDAATKDDTNPDPTDPSKTVKAFHQTSYCEVADLDHSWNGTHKQIHGGLMDGFTAANAIPADPTGKRAMGYYDATDLPYYYALYKEFATGDHFFASAPTQTFPNRFYLLAGTSFVDTRHPDFGAETGNRITGDPREALDLRFDMAGRSVFNIMDEATPPVSWKVYVSQPPLAFANEFKYVRDHPERVVQMQTFFADAAAGTLPQVSYVDPIFLATPTVQNDEHPPSNPQNGQLFTSQVINAVMASPNWGSSAVFLTYDEHGGYFDHVAPPAAVKPDNGAPHLKAGDELGEFNMYGIRVPAVVVSPFAKRGEVAHEVYDHTSILAFIEKRFGLTPLTFRDAAANPMTGFFDFNHQDLSVPALPTAQIDPAHQVACAGAPMPDDI